MTERGKHVVHYTDRQMLLYFDLKRCLILPLNVTNIGPLFMSIEVRGVYKVIIASVSCLPLSAI